MEKNTGTGKRPRSPDHPYFSLAECVSFTEKLYDMDKQNQVPKGIAFNHMGMKPKSSTAMRALSSLLAYKLLEDIGVKEDKHVWVSELAKRIIVDKRPESADRKKALRGAVLAPPMMRKIWEKWMAGLPEEDSIKTVLMLDLKFTERAAGRFASVIINNFDYAKLEGYYEPLETDDSSQLANKNNGEDEVGYEQDNDTPFQIPPPKGEDYKISTLTLAGNKEVVLHSPSILTQEDFNFMILWMKQLKLVKKEKGQGIEYNEAEEDDIPF